MKFERILNIYNNLRQKKIILERSSCTKDSRLTYYTRKIKKKAEDTLKMPSLFSHIRQVQSSAGSESMDGM